jgi:hypothetical protein
LHQHIRGLRPAEPERVHTIRKQNDTKPQRGAAFSQTSAALLETVSQKRCGGLQNIPPSLMRAAAARDTAALQ